VESGDAITIVKIVVAATFLCYASALDWRTRKVPNVVWIALSAVALFLLPVQVLADEQDLEFLLVLVPILAILSDVYWDTPGDGLGAKMAPFVKYAIAVLSLIALGLAYPWETYAQHFLGIPAMMLAIVVMYMLDIIRGGADAKALLALSILFPFYPSVGDFPLVRGDTDAAEILFPFAFVILVNAAIIVALVPLGFLAKNLKSGDHRFPQAFLGYRMDSRDIVGKHVWLMERMENGRHAVFARPQRGDELKTDLEALAKAGRTRVWVTPKIPFIIPMTASLVVSVLLGNILMLLFPI